MTLPKGTAEREIVQKVATFLPKFEDVFDEESFYLFVILFIVLTVVLVVYVARRITLKDAGHLD